MGEGGEVGSGVPVDLAGDVVLQAADGFLGSPSLSQPAAFVG